MDLKTQRNVRTKKTLGLSYTSSDAEKEGKMAVESRGHGETLQKRRREENLRSVEKLLALRGTGQGAMGVDAEKTHKKKETINDTSVCLRQPKGDISRGLAVAGNANSRRGKGGRPGAAKKRRLCYNVSRATREGRGLGGGWRGLQLLY